MIELGQTVGNYRVVAKVGEGGMGAVYLAEHPVIGRKAALKVIHPQHARNPDVVARFVNEATAINRIGHQHIVEVTDFGRTPAGDFYFIMEYLEGEPLAELIAREAPLPPERARAIAAQIADALHASHTHGVIHRDLKPDNVFIIARDDDPTFVKVLDFGLAKLVHDDGAAPHETRRGIVMGTPYYMSPEQCQGRRELDQRADIYSLGVLLFEMLTGQVPFGGDNYADVLMKQLSSRPPLARSLVPSLPEELDAILHRALAKEPDERFATMDELRQALLEPAPASAPRPRRAPATNLDGGGVRLVDNLDRVPRNTGLRNVALVAVTALAGMAAAAGATYGGAVRATAGAPPPAPRTVAITFSSDPTGATIVAPDGVPLGTTPLSIQIERSERPVAYRFEKAGFEPKAMESIPNVPSAMFALLQPAEARRPDAEPGPAPAALDDDPPVNRRVTASRRTHARTNARAASDPDGDGVLAPSFDK